MAPKKAAPKGEGSTQATNEPPPVERPEDLIDSDDEEDDDDTETSSTSSDGSNSSQSVGATGGKKKKKKKKKKSKKSAQPSGDNTGSSDASASSSTTGAAEVDKKEADKRFTTAVATARSADDLWIKLPQSLVQDAKLKKLADAMKANSTVTSLDLSKNQITDEGVQALTTMLGLNGAPELIELDLRDNTSISAAGLTMLEGLKKMRKQLHIKTGAMPDPEAEAEAAALKQAKGAAGGRGAAAARGAGAAGGNDLTRGPMFRKYFRSGNDDDDDAQGSGASPEPAEPSVDPVETWELLSRQVETEGRTVIPAMALALRQLKAPLQTELLAVKPKQDVMDGRKPHLKTALMHLGTLEEVLLYEPRTLTLQHSPSAHPTVGSHRVFAAELLTVLLSANNTVIDRLVAASKLLPRLLHLAVHRPLCSALQVRMLAALQAAVRSTVDDLVAPLFFPGWGAHLRGPAEAKPAPKAGEDDDGDDDDKEDKEEDDEEDEDEKKDKKQQGGDGEEEAQPEQPPLCQPLHEFLVQCGTSAAGVPSGRRDTRVGWVIEVCKVLQECSEHEGRPGHNANVRRALQADGGWSEFTARDGPLSQLLQEREGDLAGPRAVRPPPPDSGAAQLAELAGGGMMSGPEILALLHGMGGMSMT